MSQPPLPTDAMDIGGARRLSLAPEALWQEARSGNAYVRIRPVTYEEIQAVYTYEVRDWSIVGWSVLAWAVLLGVTFGVVWGANLRISALVGWGIVLAVTLLMGGIAAFGVATRTLKMMRIDTHTGSMIVPNKHPRFVLSLRDHLEAARRRRAAASPHPAAAPGVPPPFSPAGMPAPAAPPPPFGAPLGPPGPPPPPTDPPSDDETGRDDR